MDKILTLTVNPAVDLTMTVDQMLPEHKLRAHDLQQDPGGGGLNVARVVRELGGWTTAAWARGGTTGLLLQELLDREEIDHVPLSIAGPIRQDITVMEAHTGAQYRFVLEGPRISKTEAEEIARFVESYEPVPRYLVLSGSLPPGVRDDYYAELAARVRRETRVVVDTSGPALAAMKGQPVFLLKPNLRELSSLVRRELETDAEILEAARDLLEEVPAAVVFVSMGSRGALVVTRDTYQLIVAPPVKPVSRVGAGDSTVGGIVTALARGDELFQAARYGVAAGSAAVMAPGTQLCKREDVERLYRAIAGNRVYVSNVEPVQRVS